MADLLRAAPDGVQHIVEVAFDLNIDIDVQVLALGGSIAVYATNDPRPAIPFWELLFKNARLLPLGSDDFQIEEKIAGGSCGERDARRSLGGASDRQDVPARGNRDSARVCRY